MQSLRDKLLQAGLVTAEQAKQSEARAQKQWSAHPAPPKSSPREETAKDRERRENRERAERQKQIRALCDAHEISERGEQSFFFRTKKRELRRLYVTPEQVAALEDGALAIVDRPNGNDRPHALVPREIAEKILALEARALRFWAKSADEKYGFEDEEPVEPPAAKG